MTKLFGRAAAALSIAFWLLAAPAWAQLNAPQTWAGTAGGTSNALMLTIHNVVALNDLLGVPIRFLPSAVSVGPSTVTINLDGGGTLGPIAITRPTSNLGVQPIVSELQTGMLTEITYDGTQMMISSPVDMTPIGRTVDFRGSSIPLGALLEDGSCKLTATYPSLSSVILGVYGSCSAGSFMLPNSQGTDFLATDNGAGRVTTATCPAPSTVGTLCGGQTQTLTLAQLPTNIQSGVSVVSPNSGFLNAPSTGFGIGSFSFTGGGTTVIQAFSNGAVLSQILSITSTGTGTSSNTLGNAHPILGPHLVGLRGIKY